MEREISISPEKAHIIAKFWLVWNVHNIHDQDALKETLHPAFHHVVTNPTPPNWPFLLRELSRLQPIPVNNANQQQGMLGGNQQQIGDPPVITAVDIGLLKFDDMKLDSSGPLPLGNVDLNNVGGQSIEGNGCGSGSANVGTVSGAQKGDDSDDEAAAGQEAGGLVGGGEKDE